MKANSVSLILTDPPYFLDRMDDSWDEANLRRSRARAGAVGGLPVGMKFDPRQGRRLYEFLRPIAEEWLRVLKPGGFALCFAQGRLVHRAALALEDAGFEIRDMLAWHYNRGQAKAFSQDHFVRRRSDLSAAEKRRRVAALGGRKTPQLRPRIEMIVLAQSPREGTFVDNWLAHRAGLIDATSPLLDPTRFPSTLISADKPTDRYDHMTAKPVPLLRHLIRIFSDASSAAVVLDPFAGGGSTGEAALREGREFVGFELNEEFASKANERIRCAR